MNITIYCPRVSEYKYTMAYIIVYRGLGVFLPTLIGPFLYLSRYAYQMWWILRRRSQMTQRPRNKNPTSTVLKQEAAQNCKVNFSMLTFS